jgi:catabolite regulation protein CreA
MSIGENYDAAKMQAMELAKQNLAGQIQTEVTALIENTVANNQLDAEEAKSVTKMVSAAKNLISQRIGRVVPVVEVYRTLQNKNKEVRVYIAYNSKMAKAAAKNAIRDELAKEGDDLMKKLDEHLGW